MLIQKSESVCRPSLH